MASLPTGWSQAEFDEWYGLLTAEAEVAADDAIRKRSPAYLQRNVEEYLATGTTVSPLPAGWSMDEFMEMMGEARSLADEFFRSYVLTRTPPELIGLVGDEVDIPPITSADWPWDDPHLISDFDFTAGKYWSGSLDEVTLAQALACERNSSVSEDYAFDNDNRLVRFAKNTPRVTNQGLWCETLASTRAKFNDDFANAAWSKAGVTVTRDGPSPYANGTPLGWRVTGTVANGTLIQTLGTVIAASVDNFLAAHAMFYWDGTPLAGPIELFQNATATDIRPYLIANRWVYVCGTMIPRHDLSIDLGLRIVTPGDSIVCALPNLTRSATITTPVLSVTGTNANRLDDLNRQVMANFPPLWNKRKFTVLMVSTPGMFPFVPVGSVAPNPLRRGWTCWEFNNPFNVSASGKGEIVDDIMTVRDFVAGTKGTMRFSTGYVMSVGTGARTATRIINQLTSTEAGGMADPGKNGTYTVHSDLFVGTQTTFNTDIVLECRLPDATGFGFNAALKPDDDLRPNAQRVGLTITVEKPVAADSMNYGYDPQNEDYVYNIPNSESISVDLDAKQGKIVLRGDIEHTKSVYFKHSPVMVSGAEIMYGCNGFIGTNYVGRTLQRAVIIGRLFSDEDLIKANQLLQVKHAHHDIDVDAWAAQVVTNGGTVSSLRNGLIALLVGKLKDCGAWPLIDDLWLLVGENTQQALTSLKQRRLAIATNSPVFTIDRGYAFDGVASYIDTGFVPSVNFKAMTGTSLHLAVYERSDAAGGNAAGSYVATAQSLAISPRGGTGQMAVFLNGNAGGPGGDVLSDSRGLSLGSKNGGLASDVVAYKNGVAVVPYQVTTTGTVLPTTKLFIGARSTSTNTPSSFRAATEGFVSIGAAIPPLQHQMLYRAIQSFMTSVGANV